ncbi:EAL domain-containing protein [Aliiglaciecola sp. NS0011-25]|uniref:EAL domain-containing protein n=1 Tax=Aliiglaciecola sp. NS0011-25 TaxID=3127654 RepID=UPI0031047BA6
MFHSIRYKFVIIIILSILISSGSVFFLAINEHENLYRKSVEQNLDAMASNIADNLLSTLSEEPDPFSIITELIGLDRYEHIKFVNVFDADWNLIHYYVHPNYLNLENFSPELTSISPQDLPPDVTITDEGLAVSKTIGEEKFPVGHLLVVQDYQRPLNESKNSLFFSAIPLVMLVVVLAMMISFWIYQRLFEPLLSLTKFTKKVESTTDYDLKYRVSGNDEVSELGRNINKLLSTINAEIKTNQLNTEKLIEQQNSMQHLANYDTLTGLPNRMFFMELLRLELARSQRENEDLAIMFFDVDGFKGVNDTLGHETGDLLLKAVASKVKSFLRPGDILARLGGDEFLIMIPNLSSSLLAVNIANRIIEGLLTPFEINSWDIQTGVSIGIAKATDAEFDINTFISNADIAMYASKEKGKGSYTVFHKKMLEENRRKVQIANLITNAIAKNEFEIHYQLKISSKGFVTGLEALLRWNNDELGSISPGEFIPIAEQSGKVKSITRWLVERVFKDMNVLEKMVEQNLVVSLNISSHDLQDRSFIHFIKKNLNLYQVNIQNIQFEMTESSYLENFDSANDFFNNIRQMGGSIALDDFGTGYSFLSYLTKIQIDTLKIDRMFVMQHDSSGKDTVVLQTILDLGHRLGLQICSEGVETAEQANYLISNGSDEMQGYYFAKPLPLAKLPEAIEKAQKLYQELYYGQRQ